MPIENTDNWYLKKHDDGEVFGPIPLSRIVEWAGTAQVAPQDMVSENNQIWTKAPMVPTLKMDWIVKLDDDHYYGPTTVGALLEFLKNGEIKADTIILDCCTGRELRFERASFFPQPEDEEEDESSSDRAPSKGIIRFGLQKRIRELEVTILEKHHQLEMSAETIYRLETRIRELEVRLQELTGSSVTG